MTSQGCAERGFENNAPGKSNVTFTTVKHSILNMIVGCNSIFSLRARGHEPAAGTPGQTPQRNGANNKGRGDHSSAPEDSGTAAKRVSFAVLPMPVRIGPGAAAGSGHISGLTDYSFELDTPSGASATAPGISCSFPTT